MKKRFAFTLAEILITLGIIGVVAALTIPNLITKIQKRVYVSQLKQGYAILNEGFKRMMVDEQTDSFDNTELANVIRENGADTDVVAAEQAAAKVLSKYFKQAVLISRADLLGKTDCKDLVGKGPRFWSLSIKGACSGNFNMVYKLYNGMYMILFIQPTCTPSSAMTEAEIIAAGGEMTASCGRVDLDINGDKGPNTWGRDAYRFNITQSGKIVPNYGKDFTLWAWGQKYNWDWCNPKSTTTNAISGQGCAARIISKGWVMDY